MFFLLKEFYADAALRPYKVSLGRERDAETHEGAPFEGQGHRAGGGGSSLRKPIGSETEDATLAPGDGQIRRAASIREETSWSPDGERARSITQWVWLARTRG
jgi:hypothetical protein